MSAVISKKKSIETDNIKNIQLDRHQNDSPSLRLVTEPKPWWKGAVIYQVYPRSFCDTTGDGIGDLRGIIQKIDYIRDLGVDALWISPFYKSPMKDFGYDIVDHTDVDPTFGTLPEFDKLLREAHRRQLKVLVDLVVNHTSDQHPWFIESRSDKINAKADWYVWADPKSDGTPPNNWLSIFGGSAWQWEPRRRQYYLHNFLSSQPDLNFHNPEVRQAVLSVAKFWLDRGVDGFRIDTANFFTHDLKLRDNPALEAQQTVTATVPAANPYAMQRHVYDKSQPENFIFFKELRQLMDQYPGTVTLGEIGDDDSLTLAASYVKGQEHLHMAYTFELLSGQLGDEYISDVIKKMESMVDDGWSCWSFSNHDVCRAVSRWISKTAKLEQKIQFSKMIMALLLSIRGTAIVYQGDELGLPQVDVAYDDLQDPYGKAFYPDFPGRDGCRTPMPWNSSGLQAGFSSRKPWLPIPVEHRNMSVANQLEQTTSTLWFFKQFTQWRRQWDVLVDGHIEFVEHSTAGVLAFIRRCSQPTDRSKVPAMLCLFNLKETEISVDSILNQFSGAKWIGQVPGTGSNNQKLSGYGFAFYKGIHG